MLSEPGQPGALGKLPPLADSQSAGAAHDVPVLTPGWNYKNKGAGAPGYEATPLENTAKL